MYLPPKDIWEGRMVQIFGGATGGNERSALTIGTVLNAFNNAFGNGAYLVESNQGHLGPSMEGLGGDVTIMQGRADVETARLSQAVAEEVYGSPPHHSYCYGGSGGGNFTLWAMERAPDLYDGGVPFMFGGSSFSLTLNAVRLLAPVIDQVIDAAAPGGTGDPFSGLNTLQREALAALYRGGFQAGAEHQLRLPMPEITWPGIRSIETMRLADPSYFEEFWSQPGYAGADGILGDEIVECEATVSEVVLVDDITVTEADAFVGRMLNFMVPPGTPIGIRIRGADAASLTCARVTVRSGQAEGRSWHAFLAVDGVLIPAGEGSFFDPGLVEGLRPGDSITIDNREFLAYCYSDRHYERDPLSSAQFSVAGAPIYPRRPAPSNELTWNGQFGGKMILQQHLMDRPCWPAVAIRYHRTVIDQLGDTADDRFRIWWTEHAQHGPAPRNTPDAARSIDYSGIVSQGVRDVIAWAEEDRAPAPTMRYEYQDGQVLLPSSADLRGGIQPVVHATANGDVVASTGSGQPVTLAFQAGVPVGTGTVIGAAWDLDGTGRFEHTVDGIDGTRREVTSSVEHTFHDAGTHLVSVRVTSHRDGDVMAARDRIENVARVRVVVR
ncbi:MAG: tannase/feruloyl esterase family alpha/beta hydrolase [Rhodococcus fascians]